MFKVLNQENDLSSLGAMNFQKWKLFSDSPGTIRHEEPLFLALVS